MIDNNNDPSLNPAPAAAGDAPTWERETLEKLATGILKEQRARRRWNIFFRLITLLITLFIVWILFGLNSGTLDKVVPHAALIEIDGTIESGSTNSAEAVVEALNRAYEDANSVGVVLLINSPGGSPVQAGIINDEMLRLRNAYPQKPLYVVVEEICASGGYYIAAAADKIFVNKASIVGSIGVLMNGFGFTEMMEKIGVERRLLTAGENKGFMDPFSPVEQDQIVFAQAMLNEIHQQFIEVVRKGRGERLKETPEMFSGLFWTGTRAVELGLADGFGSVESVAREELKATEIIDYTPQEPFSDQFLRQFGASVGTGAVKALWNDLQPKVR
jgi:protease-4